MKIGLLGENGFIASAVRVAARANGHEVVEVPVPFPFPRLAAGRDVVEAVETLGASKQTMVESMGGCDVVINAAGMAAPESDDVEALDGGNAVLPALAASAAAESDVRRFVHVSSAAVQGVRDPLDETAEHGAFSPYSRSKALGEVILMERTADAPAEVVIYRPTSVQGADRGITRQLVRLSSLPVIPVCEDGHARLPVALVENVAAAATFLAEVPAAPQIVLHPWEGMTVRTLFEAFGDRPTFWSLPWPVGSVMLWSVSALGSRFPGAAAAGRRLELLCRGQRQDANALADLGFRPPLGVEGYSRLGALVRSRERR